jgi:hypothetical protein
LTNSLYSFSSVHHYAGLCKSVASCSGKTKEFAFLFCFLSGVWYNMVFLLCYCLSVVSMKTKGYSITKVPQCSRATRRPPRSRPTTMCSNTSPSPTRPTTKPCTEASPASPTRPPLTRASPTALPGTHSQVSKNLHLKIKIKKVKSLQNYYWSTSYKKKNG